MQKFSILVRAMWDPEAGVFVATSDDIPGLVAEAATPAELQHKLEILIPELIELNGIDIGDALPEIPMVVMSEQVSKIRLRV